MSGRKKRNDKLARFMRSAEGLMQLHASRADRPDLRATRVAEMKELYEGFSARDRKRAEKALKPLVKQLEENR